MKIPSPRCAASPRWKNRWTARRKWFWRCLTSGHKLLVCGNGGSASDATHLATEFLCRFADDRRPYPAISLTANGEFMTAVCNDYHADEIFARQIWGLAEKGDVLIALTTSGKSKNILRALEEAKRKGVESIAFLGRDGGFTKGVATIDLIVPGNNTARIQEGQKAALPRPLRNGGRKIAEGVNSVHALM